MEIVVELFFSKIPCGMFINHLNCMTISHWLILHWREKQRWFIWLYLHRSANTSLQSTQYIHTQPNQNLKVHYKSSFTMTWTKCPPNYTYYENVLTEHLLCFRMCCNIRCRPCCCCCVPCCCCDCCSEPQRPVVVHTNVIVQQPKPGQAVQPTAPPPYRYWKP